MVVQKGIVEILHFTTNLGLLGILASSAVKSRDLLEKDEYLEFIFKPNTIFRRDPAWTDHVNLSITRVNPAFFEISRGWHKWEEVWWCILSFNPEILTHRDVVFTTTNNIYTGCYRGKGAVGLNALFAESVERYSSREPARRTAQHRDNWTTCEQAEVLYPQSLTTDFLEKVYFAKQEQLHTAAAQIETLSHDPIELVLAPEMFGL
jgi:hypothetical protein